MHLANQLNIKPIYRVTGTPENFLTGLRYKIWGFNENNFSKWVQLEPSDIIFFHCKGSGSFFSFRQKSVVIGFGVVGNKFFQDNTPLWIDEIEQDYTYPYRFHFSEVYLFNDVPINDDWDSQSFQKKAVTEQILQNLVDAGIPLSSLDGFPHMGSYSSIRSESVKAQLLTAPNPFNYYEGYREEEGDELNKKTPLVKITSADEVTRSSTSLAIFDDIRQKIIKNATPTKRNNIESLNKAEKAHFDVLSYLLRYLQDKGYEVCKNTHIDMFAYKENGQSLLIEAKSVENRNFISQSRKGIIQLFEYNHFDIEKFKLENGLAFTRESKVLVTSKQPSVVQDEYVRFINSMGIKTAAVDKGSIVSYGESLNFGNL